GLGAGSWVRQSYHADITLAQRPTRSDISRSMTDALAWLCLSLIVLGMVPTLAAFAQYLIIGWHGLRNHYSKCRDYTPRVAFVLPAWNEADVLGSSIDSLMSIDYPAGGWRIYVVDDASTDHTPEVMREK